MPDGHVSGIEFVRCVSCGFQDFVRVLFAHLHFCSTCHCFTCSDFDIFRCLLLHIYIYTYTYLDVFVISVFELGAHVHVSDVSDFQNHFVSEFAISSHSIFRCLQVFIFATLFAEMHAFSDLDNVGSSHCNVLMWRH